MEGFSQREKDEMLVYLSRIAHAVEELAKQGNPAFKPDNSRALRGLLKNPAATK